MQKEVTIKMTATEAGTGMATAKVETHSRPGQKLKDTAVLTREDFNAGPVSLDEIETGLFLGNLTAATSMETLKNFKITHILTLDSVPLPQHIVEAAFLTTKYVHISDMPKEDILHHLDHCVEFISNALRKRENVLVHCYFGVSRSSSVVIAYIMKQYNLDYQPAFDLVKSKRRFVQPNAGFVTQLRLYRRMGCKIDAKYQKYKLYRLRLAGDQVRKAKILPQSFNNLIKPDPAITQENPEPIVYRCRKCRRILASRSHLIVHARKTATNNTNNPSPAAQEQVSTTVATEATKPETSATAPRLINQIAEQIRKASLGSPIDGDDIVEVAAAGVECKSILFVEPIAWMKKVVNNTQGRLNCPKCEQKLGNFSWINGCQCPCGEEVTPAFYLIPSKVELTKAVQNVQTTV